MANELLRCREDLERCEHDAGVIVHGELRLLVRIIGHEPVLVKQSARRAPTTPTKLSSPSLWSRHCMLSASRACSDSAVRRQAVEWWDMLLGLSWRH